MAEPQNNDNIILKVDVDNSGAVESLDQLNDKLKYWQDLQKTATNPKDLADYNNKIKEIKGSIDSMNKAGQDSPVKNLRQQLREATQQAVQLQLAGKDNTAAYKELLATIANLKDQQDILNNSISSFNPDKFGKFIGIASSATAVVGGLAAGLQLVGIDSSTAAEGLQKLQQIQSLVTALDGIGDLNDKFKALKLNIGATNKVVTEGAAASKTAAVATNAQATASGTASVASRALGAAMNTIPLLAIITAITLLIGHFDDIKEAVLKFIPGLKSLSDFFGKCVNAVTDFIGVTSDATRALDKLQASVKRGNELIDYQIDRLSAQGGKEAEIYELKKKRTEAELNLLRKKIEVEKKLSAEENEQFRKAKVALEVLDIAEAKRRKDLADKDIKEAAAKAKAAAAKAKAEADKIKAAREADEKKYQEDVKAANKIIENEGKSARDKEVNEVRQAYKDKFDLANKLGKDISALTSAMNEEISIKNKKFDEDELKAKKEAAEKLKQIANEKFDNAANAKLAETENKYKPSDSDTPEQATAKLEAKAVAVFNIKQAIFERDLEQLQGNNEAIRLLKAQHEADITADEQANAEARKAIAKAEKDAKLNFYDLLASGAETAANIAGESTAAGKALSVAATTISTYTSAQKAYESQFLPIPDPSSPVRGTIAAGIAVAAGLANIKKILSVKIAGKSSSSAGVSLVAPTINSTVLKRDENGTNQVTSAIQTANANPIPAYIVAKELTTQEQKDYFKKTNSSF